MSAKLKLKITWAYVGFAKDHFKRLNYSGTANEKMLKFLI